MRNGAAALANRLLQSPTNTMISLGSAGNTYVDAVNHGASQDKAIQNAVLAGVAEFESNRLFGGTPLEDASRKGYVTQLGEHIADRMGKSDVLQNFLQTGVGKLAGWTVDKAGEGVEEVVTGFLDPVFEKITWNPKADLATADELWQQFEGGVALATLMSGGEAMIDNVSFGLDGRQQAPFKSDLPVHPNVAKTGLNQYADLVRELYIGGMQSNRSGDISILQSLDDENLTNLTGISENPYLSGLDWDQEGLSWQERETRFQSWSKMVGVDDSIKSLAEYYDMEYNNLERYELLGGFLQAVDKNDISPLVRFSEYERVAADARRRLTGIETASGVPISGFTTHFVDRVIGQTSTQHAGMRQGVPIENVLDALQNPVRVGNPIIMADGDIRQKFYGANASVVISLRDMKIVQANP